VNAYPDTSFLMSLYRPDAHSERASGWMKKGDFPLWVTSLSEFELMNALQLRTFRKEWEAIEVKKIWASWQKDIASGVYFQKSLPGGVFERAVRISQKRTAHYGVRALDLLHVASALELKVPAFLTFDKRQRALALAEGLKVLV
jgi:predicted nucleic acid-binding protein